MKMKLVAVMALIAFPFIAYAQEKVVPLKYGNMISGLHVRYMNRV